MDNSLNYAEIIRKTVNDATVNQPSIQAIKLYPVCDIKSGNFVVLATGFDKQRWMDNVIFHARLIKKDNHDPQIIIEEDNFEEGLVDILIESGIKKEDIVTSWGQTNDVRKMSRALKNEDLNRVVESWMLLNPHS